MKVTHVGHACILVESQGLKILSDPWWRGPCFGAQWWIYPEPFLEPLQQKHIDYIYISHGHEDHFHPGTLKALDNSARVLVAKGAGLTRYICKLGFDVIEVDEHEACVLGEQVSCRIVPTEGGDTFMTITDGQETLVNLNDALHPLSRQVRERFIERLRGYHPHIDYAFCGYGAASHFPNCYLIPGKDLQQSARERQLFFNYAWADIIHRLAPKYGFPFAADVVLLEDDLFWTNEPMRNAERPPEVFRRLHPQAPTEVWDIAPGFMITDGEVQSARVAAPLSSARLKEACRDNIARANRYGSVSHEDVMQVLILMQANIQKCHNYLASFDGDYKALIRFRNGEEGLEVSKWADDIQLRVIPVKAGRNNDYDVVYTTRLPYLRRSLKTRYGHETLFVGSGGIFEYADAAKISEGRHRELMFMMKRADAVPPPRRRRRLRDGLKRWIKRRLKREELDLYSLDRWTVFKGE